MPKQNIIQASFASGEISPQMFGRLDVNRYQAGCAILENFIVTPQGSLRRRPGTIYHIPSKLSTCRLIRFRYLTKDYMVELGHQYLRIWDADQADVDLIPSVHSASGTGTITNNGGTVRINTTMDGWSAGQFIMISRANVAYKNNGVFEVSGVANADGTNDQVDISSLAYQANDTVTIHKVVEVATPYIAADLSMLSFASSGGILFITSSKYQTRKLVNVLNPAPVVGAITWQLQLYENLDGPYMAPDDRNILLTAGTPTDTATLVSTNVAQFSMPADAGKFVEYFEGNQWKLASIVGGAGGASVIVDIRDEVIGFLDPEIRLTVKNKLQDRPPDPGFGADGRSVYPRPNGPFSRGVPITVPAGATGTAATSATGGNVTSTHSQVFSRKDVGKYLRRGPNDWVKITKFLSDSAVEFSATGITMKAVNFPTDIVSVTPGSRSINVILDASADIWVATDVGRHMRLNYSGQRVWGKITAYTTAKRVVLKLYAEFPRSPEDAGRLANEGRTNVWQMGAWSDTTGWPSLMTFHEQRAVFARTDSEPNGLWLSVSGDLYLFNPTEPDGAVLDDNGISYPILSNELQEIVWLVSGPVLLAGTSSTVWQVRAATSIQEPITPTNIAINSQVEFGSYRGVQALKVGHAVLFMQRSGRKVREATYSFEVDSWTAKDLSITADHVFAAKLNMTRDMQYQQEVGSIAWLLVGENLVGMTYVKEQEVVGWHRHVINPAYFVPHSICCVRNSKRNQDILFMSGDLNDAGAIISMDREVDESGRTMHTDISYVRDLASAGTTFGVPSGQGLWGETVQVTKNGTYLGEYAVSGAGLIDIAPNVATGRITAGLKMTSHFRSLPPEGGSMNGISQGKLKRIDHLALRVWDTPAFKYGVKSDLSDLIEKKTTNYALFTGDFEQVSLQMPYSLSAQFSIAQDLPFPLNINAVMPEVHTKE